MIWLLASLQACGPEPATPAPARAPAPAPEPDPEVPPESEMAGIWQDRDELGSGWSDTFLLYDDGRFEWHVSQGVCSTAYLGERSGRFEVTDGHLVLHEARRVDVTGERAEESGSSCVLRGERRVETVHPAPVVERLPLGECPPHPGFRMRACRRVGGTPYFRFADGSEAAIRERYFGG